MFALDALQHGGDMTVGAVQGQPALLIAPGKAREAPLDRGGGQRGRAVGDIEPDQLRGRGERIGALLAAPAGVMRPIGGIGLVGVFGRGLSGIVAGGLGQPVQRAGGGDVSG